jgi:prostamide/prostaglandin F2alpha synthase
MAVVKPNKPQLADFGGAPIRDARTGAPAQLSDLWKVRPVVLVFLRRLGCQLCRVTCVEYSEEVASVRAAGAEMVALTFEELGKGSDSDNSFEVGGYWRGPLYTVDVSVYEKLFGRKGLFSGFYGLADISKTKLAACTARGVTGNFKGDGFLLGGQFVVAAGGRVVVDKRQAFFGDDLTIDDIIEGVTAAAKLAADVEELPNALLESGGGGGGGAAAATSLF